MSLEQLSAILNENEEVGKNDAASAVQINIANVKLRKNGINEIPQDFADMLQKYNGLSCDGNVIFGVDTKTMFFPDLFDVNCRILKDEDTSCIILGQDEDNFLVYDYQPKKYRIIDQEDFEEKVVTDDLTYAVAWILKI